jgi:hypothetical protein
MCIQPLVMLTRCSVHQTADTGRALI